MKEHPVEESPIPNNYKRKNVKKTFAEEDNSPDVTDLIFGKDKAKSLFGGVNGTNSGLKLEFSKTKKMHKTTMRDVSILRHLENTLPDDGQESSSEESVSSDSDSAKSLESRLLSSREVTEKDSSKNIKNCDLSQLEALINRRFT